jgi:hypothetical protein
MQAIKKGNKADALDLAHIYSELGQRDEAFKWLEKSYENKDTDLSFLKVSPTWDKLRDDPRYADILRRMRFTE